MKITVLCSSQNHPVNAYLEKWIHNMDPKNSVDLVRSKNDLTSGNILFLIPSEEIVSLEDRNRYNKTLVIHASDLPLGRGWSPHIWQILEGASSITVSLLEAEDLVDSGDIWKKAVEQIPSNALWDEINDIIFEAELELMDLAIQQFDLVVPRPQDTSKAPTYFRRRIPEDSGLDIKISIEDQFNQIRVCDPDRFPAFFDLHGERYLIRLEKKK